ncbi:Alpha/Beta hydrolase fold [Phytophthora cactorum]|nr:Alpha/Beta hydrolase fold [Phytophthora cactorum]
MLHSCGHVLGVAQRPREPSLATLPQGLPPLLAVCHSSFTGISLNVFAKLSANVCFQLERNYLANQLSKPKFRKLERAFNVELRNRLLREDFSIPECIGKYEYFMRQEPGENFPVYYRRLRSAESDATATSTKKEVVLNQNVEPSLNHGFQFEQDEAFFVDVSQTKDARFVLINCNSKNTSEIYALDGQNIDAQPQLLRKRETGTLYFADHAAGQFFIVTNADGALNYKIATCQWNAEAKSTSSSVGQWETLVSEHEDVKIEDVDLFEKYLVLYERVHSVPRIRVCTLDERSDANTPHYIPLPKEHEICRVSPGVNRECEAHRVRFQVSTPLVPEIVFDYDMKNRKLHVLKETELTDRSLDLKRGRGKATKSSFDPEQYVCERCHVPSMSSPGVKIPLTLIHRRDITLNGQNPTLLIGYGAYGTNLEADFELEHLSLLERGWVIALAHVRGGGELGLQWYQAGKGMQKRHTFDDYVSCTHHLLDAGFTNPKRLAGKGVSAGGLIMGHVANECPQLFQALIMKVPFVDILATMQDPTLPLTVHEYDEWGDPSGPKVHEYIQSYAPCDNVRENQVYPAMFVTGSLNDQRVQFWEPAKWMYKMRKVQATLPKHDKRLMLLKMTEDEGHFGGGGRLEQLEESAMEIAFLYQALNLPMSATTQELENDIAQMEDRLANVKVVAEVEREAWRRSSRTCKNGTKWKGAAAPRNKENVSSSSTTTSVNNPSSDDMDEGVTIMPGYWDSLELAQYLQDKQLGSYAQVIVNEQITGRALLETPAPKLRKLFEDVETAASDLNWKAFQTEYVKLKKHQRRLEKACATNRSQPGSSRSVDSSLEANDRQPSPSGAMSSAGAALVFPLISPRIPASQAQQNIAKPPLRRSPRFHYENQRHLTTSHWQLAGTARRASLVARAYCSQTCQESIESNDIRISPSLSARVKVTFSTEDKTKPRRSSRVVTGRALSSVSDQPGPELLSRSDSITASRLGGSTDGSGSSCPPPKAKRLRKFNTFTRRSSRPEAPLRVDDPNNFDFLQVAAPRREPAAQTSTLPRQYYGEEHPTFYGYRSVTRSVDVNATDSFTLCPSVTSLAINAHRPSDIQSWSSNGKPVPPALVLNNSTSLQAALKQCKEYQQSKYKLDPDLFQAHQETFSSCFGAMPLNNRSHALADGAGYGRGNLLRLQEFLTVRGLHRLSLTSHAWYDLITMASAYSDALWGVHVLRMWRPTGEDEDFLHDIGVLKKHERPRRMLQILTRQVSRVMVENMKILLNPESWQLATVMSPKEGEGIRSLHKVMGSKRDPSVTYDEGELSPRRQRTAELYEQITAIYTRAGEIVAWRAQSCALSASSALFTDESAPVRPVDAAAALQSRRCGVLLVRQGNGSRSLAATGTACVAPKDPNKLQHGLQQRLLGKDSVNCVIKVAHDQNASAAVLVSLEKFLTRCHTLAERWPPLAITSNSQRTRTIEMAMITP